MDLSLSCEKSVGKRIAANAGLLVGAKALGAVIGLATLLITERALDNQVEFGIIIFLHGYMLFFAEMMTFQSWQSIIRFGADDVEAKDGPRFARLVRFGITLDAISVLLSYISAVALFSVFIALVHSFPDLWPGKDQFDPARLFKLVIGYCTVVLFQQIGTSTGVLRVFDCFRGLAAAWLVMPTVRLLGVLLAAWQGWGLLGFVAAWYVGALSRYLTVIGLGLHELSRRKILGAVRRAEINFFRPRDGLWSFAAKSYVDSSLAAGFSHLPVLLVMIVFGPVFVAVYKIADEVARLLSEGVKLLDQVIYPELARIVSAGQSGRILRLVTKASFVSLAVGALVSLLVGVFGPAAVEASVGPEYSQAVTLAILLVIGAAIFGAVAPLYPVFYAVGRPERAIYARAIGIVAYVIAFIVLTRTIGELGTAWAWIVGYGVGLIAVVIMIRRTMGDLNGQPN